MSVMDMNSRLGYDDAFACAACCGFSRGLRVENDRILLSSELNGLLCGSARSMHLYPLLSSCHPRGKQMA